MCNCTNCVYESNGEEYPVDWGNCTNNSTWTCGACGTQLCERCREEQDSRHGSWEVVD